MIKVDIEETKIRNRYAVLAIFEDGASTGTMCIFDNANDAKIAANFTRKVADAGNRFNDLYILVSACDKHVAFTRQGEIGGTYAESGSFSNLENTRRFFNFCRFLDYCIQEDKKNTNKF